MQHPNTKAFTLTELLVVVIIIGILAAAVLPKFGKVLETRKTAEAETLMAAVRTEQEKRCTLDKKYLSGSSTAEDMLPGSESKNYTYALLPAGIQAQSRSNTGYTLKMPSYADGRICCEGDSCRNLNKDYLACADLLARADYDAPPSSCVGEAGPSGPCNTDPGSCECNANQTKCCSAAERWTGSSCVSLTPCELEPDVCACNPNQAKCCSAEQRWDGTQCIRLTGCDLEPNSCECNSEQCKCATYARENPCICRPTCRCPDYFTANKRRCCSFTPTTDNRCWRDCRQNVTKYIWEYGVHIGVDANGNMWKIGVCAEGESAYMWTGCYMPKRGSECSPYEEGTACISECIDDDFTWADPQRRQHYFNWVRCKAVERVEMTRCKNGW